MTRLILPRRRLLQQGLSFLGLWSGLGSSVFSGPSSLPTPFSSDDGPSHPLFSPGEYQKIDATERTYHVSASLDNFKLHPDLPKIWKESGVTDIWFVTWLYGFFPYSWEETDACLEEIRRNGLRPHLISVPFCHGGGALDPPDPSGFPNLPPKNWKMAQRWEGSENWGFSYHAPADQENAQAIQTLFERYGVFDYFLDDDFRFASTPDNIGGCVCSECKADFLRTRGLGINRWDELMDDLTNNRDTPLLRSWSDYFCDRLTACFRLMQESVPQVDLGIMVMYMGSERAGIRLDDYRDALFRVGEGMFGDSWYDPPKQKSIELFSVLLHRRFAQPGRAFSETTIYPAGALSAENMASKLTFSTIADVRNTCFMSGLKPIPPEYWPVLAPRMKQESQFHAILKNHVPRGPFKHFWGLAGRYLACTTPFSLFLTLGVPFEVCDQLADDGWTFLGDADAQEMERGELASPGTRCLARCASTTQRFLQITETFEELYRFRRSCLDVFQRENIPYVEEETPMVLAWYPDIQTLLLWNVEAMPKTVHLRWGQQQAVVSLAPLDSVLITEKEFQSL